MDINESTESGTLEGASITGALSALPSVRLARQGPGVKRAVGADVHPQMEMLAPDVDVHSASIAATRENGAMPVDHVRGVSTST